MSWKRLQFLAGIVVLGSAAGAVWLIGPAAGPQPGAAGLLPPPPEGAERPARPPRVVEKADVRAPAVAGGFYPAGRDELAAAIDGYLKPAPERTFPKPIRAIIVPHAGYVYSAPTAARAYKQLAGTQFDRVVLLGCPHHIPVSGLAVWAKGAWDTPLGRVNVDEDAVRAMMAVSPRLREGRHPHVPDHCLEVQLPFLQKLLRPGFEIVPILVHRCDEEDYRALASALAAVCDRWTLVVVSTDLSHYPTRKDAEAVDARTLESWTKLDPAAVAGVSHEQMGKGVGALDCTMCGEQAVVAVMHAVKSLGIAGIEIVGSANSAAASGDEGRVVGYGAAVLYGDPPAGPLARSAAAPSATPPAPGALSAAAGKKLIAIARAAIAANAAGRSLPALDDPDPELSVKRGCFVTLREKGDLRGCIGHFDADASIARRVQEMAVAASAEDPRFPPVSVDEVPALELEISILSEIVPCPDWHRIVLGTHGVIVRKSGRSGVFLPQVATETGWSLEEFLSHLAAEKAGIGPDGWRDPDAKLLTFTVQIVHEE